MTKLTSRFTDAFAFAFDVHRDQTQKGTTVPYIGHLSEVAGLVLCYGGNEDEAIAALLHDTVEDHPRVVSFETISKRFGGRVGAIVEGCSDTSVTPKPPWRPRKEKYIAHLHGADESVLMVAAADKLANARALIKDYRKVGDKVWERFNAGKSDQLWYYRTVTQTLAEAAGQGRARALVEELERTVTELERLCADASNSAQSALMPSTGCEILPVPKPEVVVGVDVGEDFLDLAVARIKSHGVEHHRIALAGIETDPLGILRERLAACCPERGPRWLVLIDSPRWPRDLDCSSHAILARDPVP